ncbi:MAG: hypothetical protein ACKV2V_20960 [Blastocatellia bacterium]
MRKHLSFRFSAGLLILLAMAVSLTQAQAPAVARKADKPALTDAGVGALTSEILREVAAMRGLKILGPVKSGVKSRAEIEKVLIKNINEKTKPGELEAAGVFLQAFGLAPPDFKYKEFMIQLLTEQVAGFYDPRTRQFFIADWNDIAEQKPVMAHELTHALQDQHFDLKRFEDWPDGDGDRELAIHALIEGDASVVMYDYLLKPMNGSVARMPGSLGEMSETMSAMSGGDSVRVLRAAPAAIRESLVFSYFQGADFAQQVLRKKGYTGLTEVYARLPDSTEQILHYDKYEANEKPVVVSMADVGGLLGAGWKRIDASVNGEFGYAIILGEHMDKKEARKAAAGWGGDQYGLYEHTDKRWFVTHRSVWDSEAEAEEFFKAYEARTRKRFPGLMERGVTNLMLRFATSRGEVLMERRGAAILIMEGLADEFVARSGELSDALWRNEEPVVVPLRSVKPAAKPVKPAPRKRAGNRG